MVRLFAGAACLCLCLAAHSLSAQATPSATQADTADNPDATNGNTGPSGMVPALPGWNVGLVASGQHDSGNGWSNILTPDVAYRFTPIFSAEVSVPIYAYQNVPATSVNKKGNVVVSPTKLVTVHGKPGDVFLVGHATLPLASRLSYTFSPTMTLPSGDKQEGLGAGRVTYDLSNLFELDTALSPYVNLGFGDSNETLNGRIRRAQTSVGNLAHFEAGVSKDLPLNMSLDISAYEQLPIGNQNIYATRVIRKKTVTRITGTTGLAEDNGLNATLDIPVQRHVILSGFYNRSLRQHTDTAGASLTFLLKPPIASDGQ